METRKPMIPLIALVVAGVIALIVLALVLPQIIPARSSGQVLEYKKFQSQSIDESAVSLDLTTFNGHIIVKPGDSNMVTINVTMRGTQNELNSITFDFKDQEMVQGQPRNGARIVSLVVRSATIIPLSNVSVSLDVFVPQDRTYNATLNTSNGDIEVSSLKGEKLVLLSSNGIIQYTNVEFSVMEATTSNGNIEGSSSVNKATIRTSNGAIVASILNFGSYDITTSNGRIEVDTVYNTPMEVQAKTSNGKISYNMPLNTTQSSNNSLFGYTYNYDPNKPNVSLHLSTSNGDVAITYLIVS